MKTKSRLIALLLMFSLGLGVVNTNQTTTKAQGEESSNVIVNDVVTGGGLEPGEESPTPKVTATPTPTALPTKAPTPTPTALPTPTPTIVPKNLITITPYKGQWKYFGQKRDFILDVNYATSDDKPLIEGVSLSVESDKVGVHKFCVIDTRTDDEKREIGYQIVNNAPTYEIKEYTTTATVEKPDHIYNIEDKKAADKVQGSTVSTGPAVVVTGSSATVSGPAVNVTTGTMGVKIEAPKGYLIASSIVGKNIVWKTELDVTIKEGDNVFTYYLCSNQQDETRKAIDQTPKTVTIKADWTTPQIMTLTAGENSTDVSADGGITSSEPGTFYYIVVPDTHPELTKEEIEKNVGAHYGIVGFGRVDGMAKPTIFSFTGMLAKTNYLVYSYMEDDAGNVSSIIKSDVFVTDNMALRGSVEITGEIAIDQTIVAKPVLESVATGELSYQWYRYKDIEDTESIDEIWDETGGAEEDDLEAEDDEDDDDDEEEDDDDDEEEDDDDVVEIKATTTSVEEEEEVTTDGATLIKDATSSTYKVTKQDIGYRLICSVTSELFSGYVAGETSSFVPKLIPEYTLPSIASKKYSPKRKLSSISLPAQWSWVDNTITPVYGNSGYRAKYVPEDTSIYKTIIVRVKVPVTKRTLTSSMINVAKTKAYAGTAIKNNFKVKDGTTKLVLKKDFTVTYKNNKKLGKAKITFKGIGNYKGTVKKTYQIKKCSVKKLTYKYDETKTYTGGFRFASLTVKNGKVRLVRNKDYMIRYVNNRYIGQASIVITGIGNYVGKKVIHFSIVPKKPVIQKAGKNGKTLKVKMKQNYPVKGYYVFVSTSKNFAKKKTKEYVVSGNSLSIKKMEKGTYYIRAKAYGVSKGKSYKSVYSKKKKVVIKK